MATGLTCVRKAGAISKNRQPFARVADLDAAISFYGGKLGHRLLWRTHEAAGFALPETDAELVVHLHLGPETDILVDDVDEAFASFLSAGGEALQPPLISQSVGARVFATRSATNWSYWINQKAGWLLTLMVELRVSSREINKVRVAKPTAPEAIKNGASREPQKEASPLPRWVPPKLCQLVDRFLGTAMLHEIKLDGFRMSARIERAGRCNC